MIDKLKIHYQAIAIRKQLGVSESSPIDIFEIIQHIDHLSLVLYPMGKNISGMCVKIGNNTVIAINSSMSVGRQNFSIAHELYHFYFDTEQNVTICMKDIGNGTEKEQCADQFASYFLMPTITPTWNSNTITLDEIVESEQYYKISHQAMLYRLADENIITLQQMKTYKSNITRTATRLGYDTSLYYPSLPEKEYKTYGYYIKQAQKSLDNNLISNGKYEQLLLDAFRSDIVYDYCVEEGYIND